ncbi:MAG: bifunctional 4-hydroxy-3-methylbut-2-enyl diphosphate reductase/30S ribosomal protein S1 [Clostridia bacterium]|nr:bifunctional 4-hydroxy-3-methylbut-2-enyl diphosphate reductase/30S ribosomal protein S1 [Clostridia bacterium]
MSKTEVLLAQKAGFCFGVRRATKRLEELLEGSDGRTVATLGPLIHNDAYLDRIRERGVRIVSFEELEDLIRSESGRGLVLLTRAHGIPAEQETELSRRCAENPGFCVEDCTCPYVSKIHKIAQEYDDGSHVLFLMGKAGHPETEGILSRFKGRKYVFPDSDALSKALSEDPGIAGENAIPVLAAQTTFRADEWENAKKILQKLYTKSLVFDTICNVTDFNQQQAEALSGVCDGMIVIGGKESSNTAKLFQICKEHCADTVWIERASELDEAFRTSHAKVGIVAGASTPDDLIEEVVETMDQNQTENFGEMLDAQQEGATLNTGDVVTGTVEYVTDAEITVDLGAGVTGIIKADQVSDDPSVKLTEQFKRGDKVEAFVIRVSDIEGVAELSKKRVDSDKEWNAISGAAESGEVLEGKVVSAVKGGVIVSVSANQIFVPASQTGVPKDGDLNSIVGNTVRLKIIEVKGRKKLVGSISRVQREERRAREAAFWDSIEEGKFYTGPVKSMTSYGAFVDLGGVDGMVHMTELSWKRIKSPADVLKVGDVITVFVKSFDREKKRISLGYKTEETNPWTIFTTNYNVGDVATVKIVNMMPFGAFADIIDGVDGLIHISQISAKRIARPQDVLAIGQTVDVKIIDIDYEKRKISLSIKALLEAEPAPEEAAQEETPAEEAEAPAEEQ